MKVLVVDDSVVFRMSLVNLLSSATGVEVAGKASNGEVAIEKLKKDPDIDLIVLDMEMPVMGGLETIQEIRKFNSKVVIIVFSSLTLKGAELTMEALTLGANDFVSKQEASGKSDIEGNLKNIEEILLPKIKAFEKKKFLNKKSVPSSSHLDVDSLMDQIPIVPKLICIGSSTGGPDALLKVFRNIKHTPQMPILLVQHMLPLFVEKLALMLNKNCPHIEVKVAEHGEEILAGVCYVASGDQQYY